MLSTSIPLHLSRETFKHYVIPHSKTAWYGFERQGCPPYISVHMERELKEAHTRGMYSERECEVDCFLSVLGGIKDSFTFLDLGTGWGEWTMALAGVVHKRLIPIQFSDYHAYAVECDRKFYSTLMANLVEEQLLGNVTPIYGAVSNHCAKMRINKGLISDRYCGSSLSFDGYFSGSHLKAQLLGLAHFLAGETDVVQTVTIDDLVDRKNTFIVMDVQGAELLALQGASVAIKYGMIGHMLIGTHGCQIHNKVKDMLSDKFEFIVDAQPNCVTVVNDRYKVFCQKGQDGILLCKRKDFSKV